MTHIAVEQPVVEEGLVRRAAAGDEGAFALLIAEHNASMARVAFVIVGDREQTLDAVQAAWTIAWRKLPSLRDDRVIRSWLIAIAANEARQQVRRRRQAVVVDISHAIAAPASDSHDSFAELIDLERVLRTLSGDDRRLLALRYVADLDSVEIARVLGMSASGVRSRLARLLARLREQLDPGAQSAQGGKP